MKTTLSASHLLINRLFGFALFATTLLLAQPLPTQAVIFYSTSDPTFNTTPPTKTFTNSGWQYVGQWGLYAATAIAPNYFITAAHVGGNVGDPFIFHGVTNLTTAAYPDPESDLIIWRVDGTLSPFAPLYAKRKEKGKGDIVIGRGTERGPEVRLNGVLLGWQWGPYDNIQRWGRSVVAGIATGDTGTADFLRMAFKAKSKSSGVTLSSGDSGGPVFIKDGKSWKLAGVNFAVDGPYNTSNSGEGFDAAIFDARGLYVSDGTGTNWALVPPLKAKLPQSAFATRISSRTNWITSIIQQP
jgi:hypothetical protein